MFELGYAIGKDRVIWLLRDDSDVAAQREWNKVKILTTVGYRQFTNSDHIVESFWVDKPHEAPETIFQSAVREMQPAGSSALLYLPSRYETEAGRKLSRRIHKEERKGVRLVISDPAESGTEPLAWYARTVYSSDVVISHFSSPGRQGASVHNARCALISGLAVGMGRRVLMLAEEDYTTPIDYRDLMHVYASARDCLSYADEWLEKNLRETYKNLQRRPQLRAAVELALELRNLRLGDPVAENEADQLAEYFVETASFDQVLQRKTTVFIGRKGTGKTANMLQAADRLSEDKRNLVCVIKPFSYELEGVVRLLGQYSERAVQGYLVESLWKFLIYSEIANAAYREVKRRPAPPSSGSPEARFVEYMEESEVLLEEFAVRLEKSVEGLLAAHQDDDGSMSEQRARLSELLHAGILLELRELLGLVLTGKERVAVLIDNLDKAWTRSADIKLLAHFLLGLLGSIGRVADEFATKDNWREPVSVTMAVFLRSDIFEHVVKVAREPDKIPVSRLTWTDNELLLRVVEERYLASQQADSDPKELWQRFFCPTTAGVTTPAYILSRVLPRPRDLIYFCSAAVANAVNRQSPIVEEPDIRRAEMAYSQFALESLIVENGISTAELEQVFYEFAGSSSTVHREEVSKYVMAAGLPEDKIDAVLEHLQALSFLGIEVGNDEFRFAYELRPPAVMETLARRRIEETRSGPKYQIHPAFRSYLEISDRVPARTRRRG